jgi:hypothetical protein
MIEIAKNTYNGDTDGNNCFSLIQQFCNEVVGSQAPFWCAFSKDPAGGEENSWIKVKNGDTGKEMWFRFTTEREYSIANEYVGIVTVNSAAKANPKFGQGSLRSSSGLCYNYSF